MEKEAGSEIASLKREIIGLRDNSVATSNLQSEITELKTAVEKLLQLFNTAIGYIKEDKQGITNTPVLEKLDRLLDENTVIATGLLKITNHVEALASRLDAIEQTLKEEPLPIARTPLTKSTANIPRKEVFDRLKGAFSK